MRTQTNIKIDPEIKQGAQKRAKQLGLSLSAVINATLSQFARTGELEFSTAPRITKSLELLVAEAHKEHKVKKLHGPFKSAQEMVKTLDA